MGHTHAVDGKSFYDIVPRQKYLWSRSSSLCIKLSYVPPVSSPSQAWRPISVSQMMTHQMFTDSLLLQLRAVVLFILYGDQQRVLCTLYTQFASEKELHRWTKSRAACRRATIHLSTPTSYQSHGPRRRVDWMWCEYRTSMFKAGQTSIALTKK